MRAELEAALDAAGIYNGGVRKLALWLAERARQDGEAWRATHTTREACEALECSERSVRYWRQQLAALPWVTVEAGRLGYVWHLHPGNNPAITRQQGGNNPAITRQQGGNNPAIATDGPRAHANSCTRTPAQASTTQTHTHTQCAAHAPEGTDSHQDQDQLTAALADGWQRGQEGAPRVEPLDDLTAAALAAELHTAHGLTAAQLAAYTRQQVASYRARGISPSAWRGFLAADVPRWLRATGGAVPRPRQPEQPARATSAPQQRTTSAGREPELTEQQKKDRYAQILGHANWAAYQAWDAEMVAAGQAAKEAGRAK